MANKLKEFNALPKKEKLWQCNSEVRTYLADKQNSVQAERRLVQVFLYGLPLLVARYTTESLVVVRGSKKVQQLLQDARYKEYITLVNDGHRIALERIERATLPMEERIAAQLLVERSAMQQAKSLPQASTTMLVGSKAQLVTSHTCVVESESEDQQAPLAKFPKSGVLHFAALNTVEDAFNEWPKIESQVGELGGWKELSK